MIPYYRKVQCSERLPGNGIEAEFITNIGEVYSGKIIKQKHGRYYLRACAISKLDNKRYCFNVYSQDLDYWLEPVADPLYTAADMSRAWDAALSHALHLEGYKKSFEEFIKSFNEDSH